MRDLSTVITQLLEVIPSAELVLRDRLLSTQNKLRYAAPESFHYHWSVVAWILHVNTLDRDDPWIKVTESIFNDNPALLDEITPSQTNLPP